MQIFSDTINFIRSLSYIDIVFFLAVLALMLLIITLIYFINENKEEKTKVIDSIKEEITSKIEEPKKDNTNLLDLKSITEALEAAEESENHNLVKYEEEQEEKAIISYDELIKHKNDFGINYSEEESIDDDLTIKKVDLDNLINKEVRIKPEVKVSLISYEKEEAFLKALKTLQQQLN